MLKYTKEKIKRLPELVKKEKKRTHKRKINLDIS